MRMIMRWLHVFRRVLTLQPFRWTRDCVQVLVPSLCLSHPAQALSKQMVEVKFMELLLDNVKLTGQIGLLFLNESFYRIDLSMRLYFWPIN